MDLIESGSGVLKQTIIPIVLVAVVASIILPVPAYLMDFLLISNLILALLLLVSTLYLGDPLRLSSLPTILLLATLFRLALNISSTRLILGSGDAGKAIEAFGSIVIQDNLIVGIVVFIIITLVQFIVIAKGSERVAEVSARFTLDALPGKQMSIDADVRAGLIDIETARNKRQELQTESRFYGALDGAMKFVKGDAVAGMIICFINITAGLALGIFSEGLEIAEAVGKYSMLTIGDGLVSQIPALLNALAAGIVVTRVTRGDDAPLTTEMISQLGQVKAVKIMLAIMCLAAAWLPSVPTLPLLLIGALLLLSCRLKFNDAAAEVKQEVNAFQLRVPAVLEIRISKELARKFSSLSGISERIDRLRQEIFDTTGIALLRPDISALNAPGLSYAILSRGVTHCEIVVPDQEADTIFAGLIDHLRGLILREASDFVDDIMTRRCLDYFDKEAPELVSAVVPNIISVTQLTFILKALVSEGITIRNFDLILQAAADSGSRKPNERFILEEVRISLRRVITMNYRKAGLRGVSLSPALDLSLAHAERNDRVIEAEYIGLIADRMASFGEGAALVVSRSSRMLIRECLAARGMRTAVFAYEELVLDGEMEWLGTIEVRDGEKEDSILESLAA